MAAAFAAALEGDPLARRALEEFTRLADDEHPHLPEAVAALAALLGANAAVVDVEIASSGPVPPGVLARCDQTLAAARDQFTPR